MKKLVSALLITAVAAIGCGTETEPGGPGADPAPAGANGANGNGGDRELQNEDNTFTMTVPDGATNVQAGAPQAVTISIDRGDQFNEAVTLQFSAPAGVTVEPRSATIEAGAEEADVTVSAPAGTRPGEHTINVTATPASGQNPVRAAFKIEVEAAEGPDGDQPPAGRQPAGQPPAGRQPAGDQQPPTEPAPTNP